MFSPKSFVAGASAVALASGALLAGAGAAGAQGSAEIAADLELAATALNGPVTVTPNDEGGPTVSYINETENPQNCLGFTLPYSTIAEEGIDPSSIDSSDLEAAGALLNAIDTAGGVSLLTVDNSGDEPEPTARDSYVPGANGANENGGILQMVAEWFLGVPNAVLVGQEVTVEWDATAPEEPAAAAILCTSEVEEGEEDPGLQTYFGIDPQVVADQINDRLGPLGSIDAGSVSGGSVEMGANLLGSADS